MQVSNVPLPIAPSRRVANKSSDMTYGVPSNNGRGEGEGALGKKRVGNRNDFMGQVYKDIANNITNELTEMPITVA